MKVTTDESLDLMQECLPYMDQLVLDERAKKMMQNDNQKKFVALEMMLGENREALYNIIAIVSKRSVETIQKQSLKETWKMITEVMDGEFFTFFTLLSVMAQAL